MPAVEAQNTPRRKTIFYTLSTPVLWQRCPPNSDGSGCINVRILLNH